MDSCQIFNFLFGTRKATSELRKCFSSSVNGTSDSSSKSSSSASSFSSRSTSRSVKSLHKSLSRAGEQNGGRQNSGTKSRQKPDPPPSPLKQIQMKIVNFASGATNSSTLTSISTSTSITSCSSAAKSISNNLNNQQHNNVDKQTFDVVTTSTRQNCKLECGGTYKATLVELPMEYDDDDDDDDDDHDCEEDDDKFHKENIDTNNNNNCNNNSYSQASEITAEPEERFSNDQIRQQNRKDTIISTNGNESSQLSQSSRGVILYDNPCEQLQNNVQDSFADKATRQIRRDYDGNAVEAVEEQRQQQQQQREDTTDTRDRDRDRQQANCVQLQDDANCENKLCSLADRTSERVRHLVRSFESFDAPAPASNLYASSPTPPSPPPSPPPSLPAKDYYQQDARTVTTDQPRRMSSFRPNSQQQQITPTRSIKAIKWPPPPPPSASSQGDTITSEQVVQQQQQQQVLAKSNCLIFNENSTNNNSNNGNGNGNLEYFHTLQSHKPTTIVKPLPPKTPPKSNRVKCFNLQLTLNKPVKIEQLFQDESFLKRHFFSQLQPLDRCSAAQVCRQWRNILYSNQFYWKDLVGVIDCTQLRREHLIECIMNTLSSAKLKQHSHQPSGCISSISSSSIINNNNNNNNNNSNNQQQQQQRFSATSGQLQHNYNLVNLNSNNNNNNYSNGTLLMDLDSLDQDEIWRIQELCNRYTTRGSSSVNFSSRSLISSCNQQQHNNQHQNNQQDSACLTMGQANSDSHQQQQQQATNANCLANSKSSSIPSQISSTLSSMSISSLLSPLSESSRVDSIREKLYTALDERGFDAICLSGATDDDIEELVCKTRPNGAQQRVLVGRLNNCPISDKGLDLFVTTFNQIEELELTGCNEITNAIELKALENLRRLIITDCINIADGLAQQLIEIFDQLDELVLQAYHLTDAFLEYISLNNDTSKLKRLELPNCKEITNSSMLTIAKSFQNVETLSISGSTKISDDGIEILTEHGRHLKTLDLSWCNKITDVSLECIACDLGNNLSELILDRNIHITDIGLRYLATMSRLSLLYIRWCPRITDSGLKSVLTMRTLRRLSLAGLHQITERSLLCLVDTGSNIEEVELTNCPAVSSDLMQFLRTELPKCNIIF